MSLEPTPRHWFQFRLRTIFAVIMLLALPLAWIANERQKQLELRQWSELLNSLYNRGGKIEDQERSDEYLHISDLQLTDDDLRRLGGLPNIRYLRLQDTQLTDARLAHLAGLKSLETLHLKEPLITDAGLAHLAGLKNLQALHLESPLITDAGLAHLESLKNLQALMLNNT